PWNFPLAIFTGQIVAALMAGNAVLAKPAEQTPIIAARAVELMHLAGIPKNALQLLPGDGNIGALLVQHNNVAGVAFTGSTEVAREINRTLAAKDGPIAPLIAETGGQNAMIVDSSALPEQVVDDAILSAFGSAGQRCSALRIMFVQEDVADKITHMLKGAMAQIHVGDPALLQTDIGPVIDEHALEILIRHHKNLEGFGKLIAQAKMDEIYRKQGTFFAPIAYEIPNIYGLKREVFGPALHVIRFKASEIDDVINQINGTGYGLTCGVHSRIDSFQHKIARSIKAGNIYINRSMIGAVVGTQPFGGMGLSGTGPKAGGPHYLHRFATEKTLSVNTTAAGGNTSLVMLAE
ncbi:MAG TPA: L-glutamate gamma-semialdehyde dehydrogenase, partial [Alphaproteobacteria bacterium]|nr:L-glutamate gamma-semialdehyde dehydrogenase [Alphaproteobacteria bacterium]